MPTENPYQSPHSDSTPDPPSVDELFYRKRPTWRFFVLALLGTPPLAFLVMLAFTVRGGRSIFVGFGIAYGALYFVALFAVILCRRSYVGGAQTTLLRVQLRIAQLGIIATALFALPGSLLLPFLLVVKFAAPYTTSFELLGALASIPGPFLVAFLTSGLWQDTVGRPKRLP